MKGTDTEQEQQAEDDPRAAGPGVDTTLSRIGQPRRSDERL